MNFDLSAEVEGVRRRHVRNMLKKVETLDFNCLYAAEKLDISEVPFLRLAQELEIDLWTLDTLWWEIDSDVDVSVAPVDLPASAAHTQ